MFETGTTRILLYRRPVDMRRSINGLSILVCEHLDLQPYDGSLYVFCNRARDKVKILYWQRNGFCLWYKRLEKDRFRLLFTEGVLLLSEQQLRWFLDGLDYTKLQAHQPLSYQTFY